MFVTKATRHDVSDLQDLLASEGLGDAPDLKEGPVFIARDGLVVGSVRLQEVAPHAVVLDKMVVKEERRRQGIGAQLLRAAMNNRGGKIYLCCHEDSVPFYESFDFAPIDPDALPEPVMDHFVAAGEYPSPEGHPEHVFLTAR